ncbi:MAG: sigma-54-dependent Fis family transcriptional regulator, partial [Planctomycetaceae bacterium]|nr:sigma-54-dependent Fis family transcriptional regulator [Planctomycetaceae bacterium]
MNENSDIPRILVIDDEQSMCELIETDLRLRGMHVDWFTDARKAITAIDHNNYDVVLTDIRMPGTTGLQLCQQLTEFRPDIPVVLMTAFGSLETAVSAMRAGAYDFITKPIEMDLLAITVRRAIDHHRLTEQVRLLKESTQPVRSFGDMIGNSPAMQALYDQLERIAASDAGVLIIGESGTGKELVSRCIHAHSRRANNPFVAINCAALSESLLESE